MSDYKTCTRCGDVKLPELFRWNASKGRHEAQCVDCENESSLARHHAKPKPVDLWTPEEIESLEQLYEAGGASAVHEAHPNRSLKSIGRKARERGLQFVRSRGEADSRIDRSQGWPVPEHKYTPADLAVRGWRTARPVGAVFAPSLGIAA